MFTRTTATTADRRLLRPISPFTPHPSAVRASRLPNKRSCVGTSTEERQRPQRSGKSFFLVRERSRAQLQCMPPAPYPLTPSPHAPRGYQQTVERKLVYQGAPATPAKRQMKAHALFFPHQVSLNITCPPRLAVTNCRALARLPGSRANFKRSDPWRDSPRPIHPPALAHLLRRSRHAVMTPRGFALAASLHAKYLYLFCGTKKRIRFRNPFSLRRLL